MHNCHVYIILSMIIVSSSHDNIIKCQYINPELNMVAWADLEQVDNCNLTYVDENNEDEVGRERWGLKAYAYNVLISDRIGARREILSVQEPCKNVQYEISKLPIASIIIVYHNEAVSVLIRMINSIIDRSPKELLKEIILLDDKSDADCIIEPHIKSYESVKWAPNLIKYHKNENREGLIRSKIFGARFAKGEVLIFLDSHCEVAAGWLPPLLQPIADNNKRVTLPVVDIIHPYTFNYSHAMIAIPSIDWKFEFEWAYHPWSYFDDKQNFVTPFKAPGMSGGLIAISKSYFHSMGEYDPGMDIWGGENVEMSLRIWMCGGEIVVAPCSRVGHIFRYRRPYKNPTGRDEKHNIMRAIKVWVDDEKYQKYISQTRKLDLNLNVGDLKNRLALKDKLNCNTFQWYLENVNPDLLKKFLKDKTEL